jgi:hypothetical protein
MARLIEGEEYIFSVEKLISLPDESKHFVLQGPDRKKYLLPEKYYTNYGIKTSEEIICKVDRINCKGQVFLEPGNPWYKEGHKYQFVADSFEERTDNWGIRKKIIVVLDRWGNKVNFVSPANDPLPEKGSVLNLVVERISKGKIYLIKTSRALNDQNLKLGRSYEFTIERIEKGLDDSDHFIIRDPFDNHHAIMKHYYDGYGLKLNSTFRGRIVKFNKNGERTIEPENPFYKISDRLILKITGCTKNILDNTWTLNLTDKLGFEHNLSVRSLPAGQSVECRVIMIRKGKPLLKLL